jgi:hypothetical protein
MAQSAAPLGDTYSNSARPGTNFGSQTTLLIQEGANTYIQFNLATLPPGANVSKATLRLFVSGVTTSGSFDVYPVDSSWTESTLNYNNEPPLGASVTSPPIAVTTSSVNQFVLIDITSLVQEWVAGTVSNNGIALVLQGTTGSFSFDSKENTQASHHPELEIAMTGPVGPQGPQGPTGVTGPAGPMGAPGATGAAGVNAYTTTAGSFTQPASGSNTTTIALGNSSWMSVGQVVFLTSGGYYSVASTPTGTSAVLTNLGYTGNAPSGTTIATAQAVSPAGLIGATGGGLTGVAAGTDLTGGGTSGNVTLNLDTTKVPTLAASNTFSGVNTFGSTITGSVSGTASNVTGTIAVANGGTGGTTASGALTNLGAASLASPAFTGTPTAPTAANGTDTTQIATTAYVQTTSLPAGNLTGTLPAISGASLTSLNPASISTGTAVINISGNAATATTAVSATAAGSATNFTGSLSGDVTGTQGATSVVKVNGAPVSALANVLASNGSSQLTAATAHNIGVPLLCADSSGSGTAQSCTTSPSFSPVSGDCITYSTTTANAGTGLTLNVNGLGAASVAKWQGTTTLAPNDVLANKQVLACYDGTNWELATVANSPGGGTLTSVGLSLPNIFTVTNSPVTSSGTLTGTLASEMANTFFAAPNGSSGVPSFRPIAAADLPSSLTSPAFSSISSGTNANTLLVSGSLAPSGGGTIVATSVPGSGVAGNITGYAANVTGTVAIANGGTGATTASGALTSLGAAALASPSFTGTPTVPTASAGTNNTQIATTAYVNNPNNLYSGVDSETGTSYLVPATDQGKLVTVANSSGIALTLPAASSVATGWWIEFENTGTGTATLTPSSGTIDGAASLSLATNQGVHIVSNGTNYFSERGIASSSFSGTLGVANGGTGSNLSSTGGTSQVLQQTTTGGVITVGQLAASNLSNGTIGSGSVVLANSPALTSPALGTPSSVTLTNGTGLPLATGVAGQLLLANGGTGASLPATALSNLLGNPPPGSYLVICTSSLSCTVTAVVGDSTATIGTAAISANSCSSASTITMTGATPTQTVKFTPTTDLSNTTGWSPGSAGQLYIQAIVSAASTVSYKVCNPTGSSITPGASTTWNVSVY